MSRGGSSMGDRGETDLTQQLPPTGANDVGRNSSGRLANHRPGAQLEADPRSAARQGRVRKTVFLRDRQYRINASEQALLTTVGTFRAIAVNDLVTYQYARNGRLFAQDLRSLKRQGLIRVHRLLVGGTDDVLQVMVITREAKRLLATVGSESTRRVWYAGLVKPREVSHDAAIYRMYEVEAAQIRDRGGVVRRVVLDYELKASIFATLAKFRSLPAVAYARCQSEVAHANGLPIAGGRICLPDLRLEYQTADGDLTKIDLELATRHYHGAYSIEKANLGFKLYADGPSAARLKARLTRGRGVVPDEPGLTDAIFSL